MSDPDSISSFRLARGFRAAGTACGLKPDGALDLALVAADGRCAAAGTFTTNRVRAAPVLLDEEALAQRSGSIRAVVANSGCANACTGTRGMEDARRMAELAAKAVGCEPGNVLVLSTGVIGRPLDMEKIASGIAGLGPKLDAGGAPDAARAILTTDTRPKTASADLELTDGTIGIHGFAKGAGMIHPDMATMLAVITTDAAIEPRFLSTALHAAVARTFNRISVDGDMSTNDTVLVLASGVGVRVHGADLPEFEDALELVCGALARQIARDGEGATRLVEIEVTGALDEATAHAVADAIGRSALVKTAIHGGDPNWGRVLAAAGASGQPLAPDLLSLWFGPADDPLLLVEEGLPVPHDPAAASALLRRDPVRIRLDLGPGDASATVWTCDMSAEYVAINAHYTT